MLQGERMRMTAYGQPNVPNPNSFFCTYPTRVAISEDGNNPITKPRSLLHLGFNTGINLLHPGSPDGWRDWMDIGTFASSGTDDVYIGLKYEGFDRQDAVISWGDNQALDTIIPLGPDNLRFIFAATQTGLSTAPANSNNGMEGMRMTPSNDSLVYTGIGGSPATNPYYLGGDNPTMTLEVNSVATSPVPGFSGMRFTDLRAISTTVPNPGPGVLAVDSTGVVIYVPSDTNTMAGAENGCSINLNHKVVLGNDVNDPNTLAKLFSDREIPMDKFDILFTNEGRIAIGDEFTNGYMYPDSKLEIRTEKNTPLALDVTSGVPLATLVNEYHMSEFHDSVTNTNESSAIYVHTANKVEKLAMGINLLVDAHAPINVGVYSRTDSAENQNLGAWLGARGLSNYDNSGVFASGWECQTANYGGKFRAGNPLGVTGGYNGINNYGIYTESFGGQYSYGIKAIAKDGSLKNIGIYAEALPSSGISPPPGPNYAGYFVGDVYSRSLKKI